VVASEDARVVGGRQVAPDLCAGPGERSGELACSVLCMATAWAAKGGLLTRDPLSGYEVPRPRRAEVRSWTMEEARAFLAFISGDRDELFFALALCRGTRRGEGLGLKRPDLDLETGIVSIRRARILVDGKPAESSPKTWRGQRAVLLDDHLGRLARAHLAGLAAEKLAAGPAYADGDWLFCDESGEADVRVVRVVRVHD
jgi:integrase